MKGSISSSHPLLSLTLVSLAAKAEENCLFMSPIGRSSGFHLMSSPRPRRSRSSGWRIILVWTMEMRLVVSQ